MFKIASISSSNTSTAASASKPSNKGKTSVYTVQKGESLTAIAKKFGMTVDEFCKWTGFSKSKTIHPGDKIPNLMCAEIPKGKGLKALYESYGMDKEAFCAMNGIDVKKFNSYNPKAGEKFYVWKGFKKGTPATTTQARSNNSVPAKKADSKTPAQSTVKKTEPTNNKKQEITKPYSTAKVGSKSVRIIGSNKLPPIPKDDKGHITAEVIKFNPQTPSGPLKGKTIMVNAGHGWKASGAFDIGAPGKDVNGKEIDEWRKNRDFAEELINELTARGATVIFTSGHAPLVCNAKAKYKADAFISIHCNGNERRSLNGLDVYYMDGSTKGNNFASLAGKKIRARVKKDTESNRGRIGVLRRESQIPSILLEMGYLTNSTDQLNVDSIATRKKQMKLVADSIVEYFNPPESKPAPKPKTKQKTK